MTRCPACGYYECTCYTKKWQPKPNRLTPLEGDMLEALRDALSECGIPVDAPVGYRLRPWEAKARAAIAKAEGRDQ